MADSRPQAERAGSPRETPLVGALWIPHLPLVLALRRHPELDGQPMLVSDARDADGVVIDASAEALACGVRLGQSLGEAHECCPEAAVLPHDPRAVLSAHEDVLDLLETVVPTVEDQGVGRALFPFERSWVGDDGQCLLAQLRARLFEALGLRARLALAPGRFIAGLAALREAEPVTVVADGAAYLAPLPIAVLPLSVQAQERLHLLGIATAGQFARLPRSGLTTRFGPDAAFVQSLARGQDPRPVVPRPRPEARIVRHIFEPAVESVEPLHAVAERLLGQLCRSLQTEDRTFQEITVALELETGVSVERGATLREPAAALDACRTTLRALVQDAASGQGACGTLALTLGVLRAAGGTQLTLAPGATGRDERGRRLDGAVREAARRYPARLRRGMPAELPAPLGESRLALPPVSADDAAPTATPVCRAAAPRVRLLRRGRRSFVSLDGRWDEIVSVSDSWRAEEWWPAPLTRVYYRVRTCAGRLVTLAHDAQGWQLVEVAD